MKTKIVLLTTGLLLILFSCKRKDTSNCEDCKNGGYCVNDTCFCPNGYEGTKCETKTTEKFLGNYTVLDSGTFSWTSTISTDTNKYATFGIYRTHLSTIYEGSRIGEIVITNYFGDGKSVNATTKKNSLEVYSDVQISYRNASDYRTSICFLNQNYYPKGSLSDTTITISFEAYCNPTAEVKQTKCISVFRRIQQ